MDDGRPRWTDDGLTDRRAKNQTVKGININGKEFRLSQYADDIQIFLDGTERSLQETLSILNMFYSMSGLKINIEKTRAILIGALSNSETQMCRNQRLDWSQGPFKVLGVTFTMEVFDIWDINSNEILIRIENLCKQWLKRKLTLMGRITITKSLPLSKFTHLFLALPNPPEELIKKLNKIFFTFLWNSGPVSQFILSTGQLAPWGASQPWLACPPRGQAVPGYLTPCLGYLYPRGASCPGRFILPPRPYIENFVL